MRVGGSVKTQLSYDRDLLVWQWLHVSAVLVNLQVINCFANNNNKEKTYTWDKVYLEVLYISGVQRDLVVNGIYWLKLYKYKITLNLETGMKKIM